ncbi:hypothetical protein K501DRAFT_275812 [Backusella circina FSU 941]|nr:hypothetical protein K501DRAFT_275812 [Backusella circina FSU 941]
MTTISGASYTLEQFLVASKNEGLYIIYYIQGVIKEGNICLPTIIYISNIHYNCKKQYDLGLAWYILAASTPINYLYALKWYLNAAEQTNTLAFNHITEMLEYGQGVPVNKYKALDGIFVANTS